MAETPPPSLGSPLSQTHKATSILINICDGKERIEGCGERPQPSVTRKRNKTVAHLKAIARRAAETLHLKPHICLPVQINHFERTRTRPPSPWSLRNLVPMAAKPLENEKRSTKMKSVGAPADRSDRHGEQRRLLSGQVDDLSALQASAGLPVCARRPLDDTA